MESIGVIIPNYNGKKYLTDCLRSLQKQSYRNLEVILVDNGSEDGSIDLVKRDFPSVKIVALPENTGFANAVNVGIRETSAKYVFLLNNDTICDSGVIEALSTVLDKKPNVFSVQAKMLQIKEPHLVDDAGDYYCALGWAFAPGKDKVSEKYVRRTCITSACAGAAMYRKKVFEEIGYFDKAHFCYLEDVDVGYRARLYGYVNVMEPEAVVYHVGSASSGSRHNAFKVELTAANNLYFIYKNLNFVQIIINLPLLLLGVIIKHIFYVKKGLGKAHIKGLSKGFSKILKNRDKKVSFGGRQIAYSILMQFELWINLIRRLS